jgi:hypothetical protein
MQETPDSELEFKIFREDTVVCPRDLSLLGVVEVRKFFFVGVCLVPVLQYVCSVRIPDR